VQRGEIWWAELREPFGSEPGFRRPVLIVQDDAFNRSRIQTVIVIAITTNVELAKAPGNVLLPTKVTCLPRESVANVSQLITIDKSFLSERVGSLPLDLQEQVDAGLRLILYL
jgi:mRNA interferase MazF